MKRLLSLTLALLMLCSFTAYAVTFPNTTVVAGTSDDNPPADDSRYTNGLFVQGAQVRTEGAMGLRFIGLVNETMLTELKNEGAIDIQYGFLVLSGTKTALTVNNSKIVISKNIYKTAQETDGDYSKFTACVVNIPTSKYKTSITVRPYIRYVNAETGAKVIYGESYTANLYSVAKTAYNSGKETTDVENYLLNNILYVANPDFPEEYTGGIYKP
jgi:hypothetical protein